MLGMHLQDWNYILEKMDKAKQFIAGVVTAMLIMTFGSIVRNHTYWKERYQDTQLCVDTLIESNIKLVEENRRLIDTITYYRSRK